MALAKVLAGKSLLIKVSDGAGTPVFAHPCLINTSRGITLTAETNDTIIPDCSDPELLAWMGREKVSLSAALQGAGTLNTPDVEFYYDWWSSPDPIATRVELNGVSAGDGGGWFAGNFHLVTFEITGDRGTKAECSLSFASDGAVPWVPAS
ncbi:MAG: phage tail tube protein [Alsobacter sp.]